jgi:hypothetical protein
MMMREPELASDNVGVLPRHPRIWLIIMLKLLLRLRLLTRPPLNMSLCKTYPWAGWRKMRIPLTPGKRTLGKDDKMGWPFSLFFS